jgi:hypothetical protein
MPFARADFARLQAYGRGEFFLKPQVAIRHSYRYPESPSK